MIDMEERSTSPQPPPAWLSASPNLWETFLLHFRRVVGGTLLVMVAAAAASLLWPKTYRASSTIAILPPRYAANLKVPPAPLSMPSVQAIAASQSVLQDLLADLTIKRTLIRKVREGDPQLAGAVSVMTATEAAEALGVPSSEAFKRAWAGMPPQDLVSGFEDFRDKDLDRLDPIEISKHLSALIRTSLETNLTTEFQPLLTLSAEWRTPRSAALLSQLWANATLRALKRDLIETAKTSQQDHVQRVLGVAEAYGRARSAPFEFLAHHPLELRMSEAEALTNLRWAGGLSEEGEARLAELTPWIGKTEAEYETLRNEHERSAAEFDYTLGGLGGVEAMVEDYEAILRANLLGPPTPPLQKIRPRRSAIVLGAGLIAFFIFLGQSQIREMRRAL